jgi:hypothetical protein
MEIKTLVELRNATEDNLTTAINSCLTLQQGQYAPDTRKILEAMVYLEELRRRSQDKQARC